MCTCFYICLHLLYNYLHIESFCSVLHSVTQKKKKVCFQYCLLEFLLVYYFHFCTTLKLYKKQREVNLIKFSAMEKLELSPINSTAEL